jgi:hypothetical protein
MERLLRWEPLRKFMLSEGSYGISFIVGCGKVKYGRDAPR